VLLDNLPPDAAIWRDEPPAFNRQDEFWAVVVEEMGRLWAMSHNLPQHKAERVIRDIRPKPPPRVLSKPQEIAAFLSSRFS
jgi:hypothetical protein